jgi:hypothetical protein
MVPCTLLRKLSFLLWYTTFQFLLVYVLDTLVLNSTMTLGFMIAATQQAWLMCTYLFVFGLGVHAQFTSASEEEKLDEKKREGVAHGERQQASKGDGTTTDHLMAAWLWMLLVVMLANWLALFASVAGTLYQAGGGMIRALWGTPGAWACIWVLFIMQSQLAASTYFMTMHYTQAVPLDTGLQMSVSLYSLCNALLLLGVCTQPYDLAADQSCVETGDAATVGPCTSDAEQASQAASTAEGGEYVRQYWLRHEQILMLVIVAATCIAVDFFVNAMILMQTFSSTERVALADKRYLKIGLLWISLFSALVILSMSDLGAYALVVLFPPLTLVFFVSWHNYKTLEAPSVFSKHPQTTSAARGKPTDAFDTAASSAGTRGGSTLHRHSTVPRQRSKVAPPPNTLTADVVYK